MTPYKATTAEEHKDTELVSRSLAGDRDAFSRIVSRYQTLISSLAYSRIGNLGQSEDVAQETFITAWKHLRLLREPAKLRAWLCGIVRNRIRKSLRREGREPVHNAEELELVLDLSASEALPSEQAVSREEEAILWRSLEKIPDLYREPLTLFYREHRSIESVAMALELSEDVVRQRLSRGRKLLHEQVLAFVEGALERTNPGKAFTLGVLAALPVVLTTSAKAATLGSVAIKGGVAAKAAGGFGVLVSILSPLVGLVGPWLQYRMLLDTAKSDDERAGIKGYFRKLAGFIFAFGLSLSALVLLGGRFVTSHPVWFAGALIAVVAGFVFAAARFALWSDRMFSEHRVQRASLEGELPASPVWEYRSRFELLGLPVVHIRISRAVGSDARQMPVKAWFAAGDTAFGVLFAFGGFAVAPVSIGGIAIGLMPWGGLALGAVAVGGVAFGGWVFGGFAIGWQAFGGCALAWNAAMGGLAVARDFAQGGVAYAGQANTPGAEAFVRGQVFFQNMVRLTPHLCWLNLLWMIPMLTWWHKLKKLKSVKRSDGD